MLQFLAATPNDLQGILQLQQRNLPAALTTEQMQQQGFVTVSHSLSVLQKMNALAPAIIAKHNDEVVAYILAMTKASKEDVPVLIPMFEQFDKTIFQGKPVSDYNYLVVGQVCVDAAFRGQQLLDQCYAAYKKFYQSQHDFAITEIATRNTRSLRVHQRIGFEEVNVFTAPDGEEWSVVVWNW